MIESARFNRQHICGCNENVILDVATKNATLLRITNAGSVINIPIPNNGLVSHQFNLTSCEELNFELRAIKNDRISNSYIASIDPLNIGETIEVQLIFLSLGCNSGVFMGWAPAVVPNDFSNNIIIDHITDIHPNNFNIQKIFPPLGSPLPGAIFRVNHLGPLLLPFGCPDFQTERDTASTNIPLQNPPHLFITIQGRCN